MEKRKFIWFFIIISALLLVSAACQQLDDKGYDVGAILEELRNLDSNDSEMALIQKGKEIFDETNTMLPENVGNDLSCISCHGEGGLGPDSPMVGVTLLYPKEHHDKWTTIEDRINGCFIRSMNGKQIDEDGEEMKAMVAYFEFLSKDLESKDDITWRMDNNKEKVPAPNVTAGGQLYTQKGCIACHGEGGSGTSIKGGPPLWGEGSFNDAAGMARLNKATAFIQNNMPKGKAGTLTDQEAADLAAFILTQKRPVADREKVGDYNLDPDRDYITKDRREKIRKGEFDWTELDVVEE